VAVLGSCRVRLDIGGVNRRDRNLVRHRRDDVNNSFSDSSSKDSEAGPTRRNAEDDSNYEEGHTNRRGWSRHRRRGQCYRTGHKQRESKVPWMKPEKFNGHGSFETFMVQFENCAKYCEWSANDKAAHLRWALTGTAAQLLWGTEDLSYEDLLERLKCRFSGKGMEEKFQTELRC